MRYKDVRSSLFLAAMILCPGLALADGALFTMSSFEPLQENEQMAAIRFRDNEERLLIALNFDVESEDAAVWIVPVPGTVNQTEVAVVDSFPYFSGVDMLEDAASVTHGCMTLVRATQIYPIFVEMMFSILSFRQPMEPPRMIEKWGIRADVVAAESMDELQAHLRAKRAGVSSEHLTTFEPFLDGKYVFVIVSIDSREDIRKEFPDYRRPFSERRPCVLVRFVTDRAFYPLRPTRLYGETVVPIRLFVLGHVRAETLPVVRRQLDRFICEDGVRPGSPAEFTEGLPLGKFHYTAFSLHCPADSLVGDLYFSPIREGIWRVTYARSILSLWWLDLAAVVTMIVGLSYLSGGLAGLIVSRRWESFPRTAFATLLTVIGAYIALRREASPEVRRKTAQFMLLFTILFVLGSIIMEVLFCLPLLHEL